MIRTLVLQPCTPFHIISALPLPRSSESILGMERDPPSLFPAVGAEGFCEAAAAGHAAVSGGGRHDADADAAAAADNRRLMPTAAVFLRPDLSQPLPLTSTPQQSRHSVPKQVVVWRGLGDPLWMMQHAQTGVASPRSALYIQNQKPVHLHSFAVSMVIRRRGAPA
jgi:hypothetical protein